MGQIWDTGLPNRPIQSEVWRFDTPGRALQRIPMNLDISPELRVRAQSLARHELGHFVTTLALGFKATHVSVQVQQNAHRGKSGNDLVMPLEDMEKVLDFLGRRIVCLLAGAVAETIDPLTYKVDHAGAFNLLQEGETGAGIDYAVAKELIQLMHNCAPRQATSSGQNVSSGDFLNKLLRMTSILVELNARQICTFASVLSARVIRQDQAATLTHEEMQQMDEYREITAVDCTWQELLGRN